MNWVPDDAPRFTKKADTQEKRELWARTANSVFEGTKDKREAIMRANSAVKLETVVSNYRG